MASTAQLTLPRMSRTQFRAFIEDKPDHERWELIDGVPVMMAPPTLAHQRIAGNLQLLLNAALERHNPDLIVLQRSGVEIGPEIDNYDPEPDILVIEADAGEEPGKRYADRFYLAAEIVSASDSAFVKKKCEAYRLHKTCTCILIAEQDRIEVRVELRSDGDWTNRTLKRPDDLLVLPDFGLRCKLSDLYRGTPLRPRERPRNYAIFIGLESARVMAGLVPAISIGAARPCFLNEIAGTKPGDDESAFAELNIVALRPVSIRTGSSTRRVRCSCATTRCRS
jgi:Uma2 family endonuclease